MRVTGGIFTGRVLETPKGPAIRPTQDRVRAALFNILGDRVVGARVLDLFAGSGGLGIEALSRGAAHVTFVDRSPFCVRTIQGNLFTLGITGPVGRGVRSVAVLGQLSPLSLNKPRRIGARELRAASGPAPLPPPVIAVLRADAVVAVRKLAQEGVVFDLVILDPPYGQDLAIKSLNALSQHAIVSPSGWVIAEHDKRDSLPAEIRGKQRRFVLQRIERYGDTALTFFA